MSDDPKSQSLPISRSDERALEELSPFELRDALLKLGSNEAQRTGGPLLNSGRGNPNFLALAPRQGFFQLGLFATADAAATKSWSPDLVGQPKPGGIATRLGDYLAANPDGVGISFLKSLLAWAKENTTDVDDFVYELVDGILGEHYPTPPRVLPNCARVISTYLLQNMGAGFPKDDQFKLFATEGGTAAMCYLFNTLTVNGLLSPGDGVALMTPVFTPYIDIVNLPEYGLRTVQIQADAEFADGTPSWQFPDDEIDKLRDPSIKALVCVNPTNPPSVQIAEHTLDRIALVVKESNPDLMIITDDVCATFASNFVSLASKCPQNCALVYSFSKYFGATGWRLGVIGLAAENVFDRRLDNLPQRMTKILQARYSSLADDAKSLDFMDRLVADSRSVALNHTAGLSGPQQVQMALFALFDILARAGQLETKCDYRNDAKGLIRNRWSDLFRGVGVTPDPDPLRVGYYAEIDFEAYIKGHYPEAFFDFLQANYEPADILFRLASQCGVVALNGAGFDGPPWSIRVSLANLDDDAYLQVGSAIRAVADEYMSEWENSKK